MMMTHWCFCCSVLMYQAVMPGGDGWMQLQVAVTSPMQPSPGNTHCHHANHATQKGINSVPTKRNGQSLWSFRRDKTLSVEWVQVKFQTGSNHVEWWVRNDDRPSDIELWKVLKYKNVLWYWHKDKYVMGLSVKTTPGAICLHVIRGFYLAVCLIQLFKFRNRTWRDRRSFYRVV